MVATLPRLADPGLSHVTDLSAVSARNVVVYEARLLLSFSDGRCSAVWLVVSEARTCRGTCRRSFITRLLLRRWSEAVIQ